MKSGAILIVDGLELREAKTKEMAQILKKLDAGRRTVIVADKADDRMNRAIRNIPLVKLLPVQGLNVYDLVCARRVLIPQAALPMLKEAWS